MKKRRKKRRKNKKNWGFLFWKIGASSSNFVGKERRGEGGREEGERGGKKNKKKETRI